MVLSKKSFVEEMYKAGIAPQKTNYVITGKYNSIKTWLPTISYLLLSIIIILFVFELLRRLFYYIIIGTIKPSKE